MKSSILNQGTYPWTKNPYNQFPISHMGPSVPNINNINNQMNNLLFNNFQGQFYANNNNNKIYTNQTRQNFNYNLTNFPGSFTISEGNSVKIYFNSNLNDLSYFLSYNEELLKENIPTECRITAHFKNYIVSIDVAALDVSRVTTMANMFKGYNKLARILFFQKETSILTNTKGNVQWLQFFEII